MSNIQPYPGLRPFQSDEDFLFFGREEQTAELMHLLQRHRFLAVVGSSGSGKSSLVRCGLMSQLHGGMMLDAGAEWTTAVMQPGGDPLAHLAQSLIDAEIYDDERDDALYQIMATINRSSQGFVEAIKQAGLSSGQNVLLVIDQFEEIFRFHKAGQKGQQLAPDFIRWIIQAVNQSEVPIYVVLTMRSDFLGDCSRFTGLAEAINQGEYLVPKLTREQLQKAIEGPARVAGGEVSRRLIQRLLNDVGEQADQLPVLQHSLMRSWESCKSRSSGNGLLMDLEDYAAVGGMQDALSNHADEVLWELQKELGDDQHAIDLTGRIFKALTEKGQDNRGIRRPTQLDLLVQITGAPREDVVPIVDAYRRPGRTFLMPFNNIDLADDVVIDISHESLMRVWKRLKDWVEQESQSVRIYKRLSETALLWQDNKAGLYRDPDLQIALSWLDTSRPNAAWAGRYDPNYSIALDFLKSSEDEDRRAERLAEENRQRELHQAKELAESQEQLAQEQAASARKFRRQFQISGVIAIIAVVASIATFYSMSVARKNEHIAKLATEDAIQSRNELGASYRRERLEAAQSAFELGDLAEALRLIELVYNRDTTDNDIVRLAMDYISQVNLSRPLCQEPLAQPAKQYLQTAEGNALGYVTPDNLLHVVVHNPSVSAFLEIAAIPVSERVANVFVDDSSIRVVEQQGRSTRFDRNSQQTAPLVATHQNSASPFAASSSTHVSFVDGKSLLATESKVIFIDHAATGDVVTEFIIPNDPQITHVQLARNGNTAFFVTEKQGYLVYDLSDTTKPKRQITNDSDVLFLAYLPLQNQFLTVESSGLIVLTSPDGEHLDALYTIQLNGVDKASVSPEGTRLAISDATGFLAVYSLIDGRPLSDVERLANVSVNDFVFDPLGLSLIVINDNYQPSILSLDGQTSALEQLPIQVAPDSLVASWSPLSKESNQKSLSIQFVQRTTVQHRPILRSVELRRTIATPGTTAPSWSELELDNLEAPAFSNFFAYFQDVARLSVPNVDPPSHPNLAPFMAWINRHDYTTALNDSTNQQREVEEQPATDHSIQVIGLLEGVLQKQLSSEILIQNMAISPELSPGQVATRYHLIKHLQKEFGIPQSPAFSQALVEQIAKLPRLLEIRSQAYVDQIHKGQPVNLTEPKLIDQWDGLAHRWNVASPAISLTTTSQWISTRNQYIIWRGAHFSDYRLECDLVQLSGNSGIDGRSILLDNLGDVYQAGYLHPYLQKGYQVDLVGNRATQAGNFHGKIINDNYRLTRPVILADRGETVVVGQDAKPVKLARSSNESTVSLLERMHQTEQPTRVTMELRGNHLTFRYGNLLLNQVFDSQDDRQMSGEVAVQALGGYQLILENFVVIPLGRDIVEAEMAIEDQLSLPDELHARLMASRKQWYALAPFLDARSKNDWVAEIKRDMNLSRRDLHRRLARAMIVNDTSSIQEIIKELNDAELLNEIAHSHVGDAGFGSQFGTPVMSGAVHGSTDALKLLFKNGVSPEKRRGVYGLTPLDAACFGNQIETVKFFIDHGCDPDSANLHGFTALHEAAKWSGPKIIKILLDAGVDIKARNNRSLSPLGELASITESAFQFGNTDYTQYAISDRRIEVARLLMAAGLDPQERSNDHPSALDLAKDAGDTELVEVFLRDDNSVIVPD